MIDYKRREQNKEYWNETADQWFGATALPELGVHFIREDDLHIFGDVAGKKLLEIGCGSGHSLVYQAQHGAGELWGLDISESQLRNAHRHLDENGVQARLICSPMEDDCGIPENYFDVVYSIYALGWTSDLPHTLKKLASYLKKDGVLIFTWRHPMNGCVQMENGKAVFRTSYFDPLSVGYDLSGKTIRFDNYKMSDYVNALADAGFVIERLVEQTDPALLQREAHTEKEKKAQLLPLSLLFKARKL